MSKAKNPATDVAFVSVNSFKDAAYQSALTSERATHIARFVLDECPNFLDDVPKEIKAQLDAGFALRWQEINPAKSYSADWVPAENGGISVTLDYCLSYSQQAFGQLKNENPVQHGIIKGVRDAFSKYRSNKLADLRTAVRRLMNEGKASTRSQAKAFDDWLDTTLDTMKTRCKTANARGDESANEVQLRVAIDAFKKAYKLS
jgi:hypothetical protein